MGELAQAGARVFTIVATGQVVLICLLAPLFMAGAIGEARGGDTLDILLTTPITNLQVVLGSLSGRLFFVYALLLSGLPFFAVLLLFGGVPISAVFISFAIAALTALPLGAVAVTLAVMRRSGRRVVFLFVIVVAAYLVGGYALDRALRAAPAAGGPRAPEARTTLLTPLHPLLALETTLRRSQYAPPPRRALQNDSALVRFYRGQPVAAFAATTSFVSLLLIVWSTLMVRRAADASARLGALRRWLRLGTAGERRRPPRPVWQNPVAWREARTRGSRTASILGRWGFALAAVAAGAALIGAHHFGRIPTPAGGNAADAFRRALLGLLLVETTVIALVAVYMAAGSIPREREEGTLDLVLTTPITPARYVWGKLRGLVGFLALLLAVPIATAALAALYTGIGRRLHWGPALAQPGNGPPQPLVLPEMPLLLALMLVPFAGLCVAIGMSQSLKARTVFGAVVPTLGLVAAVAGATGFCGFHALQPAPAAGALLAAFSPAAQLPAVVDPWQHVGSFAGGDLWGRGLLGAGLLLSAGACSAIVAGMIRRMVQGFDLTVRRLTGLD
jgi:ABC-type transport system involved in multi-copper enzyme maturation permease subunit